MTPKELRKEGSKLGRAKIAERALAIMQEAITDGSYKNAIEAIGRMKVLFDMCGYDEYWKEKTSIGLRRELDFIICNQHEEK